MASHSEKTTYEAGQAEAQAQVKKEELASQASQLTQAAKESCQQGAGQTASFLQQTGEQLKNAAQGAADAVKNTLGMGDHAASPANPTSDKQH